MSLQSRYTILRKITDGGTAEIFLAKQQGAHGFEKTVVLKRIFTAFYADPQFRHMLVDEAHIAMSLNHSNIVQVLDLGEVDGRYFLALELVDGWTLDRTLKRAQAAGVPFPPALALYVTAEVGRALAYAHAKTRDGTPLGIVHRDVSPHNVLLSAEGEVKLTDFGIAQAKNKKEQSLGNMIKGKISFMSPEQASGAPLDSRSDLFSLGTMLYAMITRRLPFDAATDYETLMLVKSGDYLPPETARPGLNPELYRVIRKAMSKSASERYQKAEEMLVDVEQVMRLAFRAVGQTELQRWLADLSAKDGVPALTREAAEPLGGATIVDPPRRPPADAPTGEDSSVVLDLADAFEVAPGLPPPPPGAAAAPVGGASVPNLRGGNPDAPWYKRPGGVVMALIAIVLLFGVGTKAFVNGRRRAAEANGSTTGAGAVAPAAETPVAAAPPTPAPAPPAPTPVAEAKATEPVMQASPASDASVAPVAVAPAAAAAPVPADKEPAAPSPVKVAAADPPAARRAAPTDDEPTEAPAPDDGDKDDTAPAGNAHKAHKTAAPSSVVAVTLKSDPEGARVTKGARVFGTTPKDVKLAAGAGYDLTFTKAGYATTSKHYVPPTAAKGPQTFRVTLKKLPEPPKKGGTKATPPAKAAAATPGGPHKGWFSR